MSRASLGNVICPIHTVPGTQTVLRWLKATSALSPGAHAAQTPFSDPIKPFLGQIQPVPRPESPSRANPGAPPAVGGY